MTQEDLADHTNAGISIIPFSVTVISITKSSHPVCLFPFLATAICSLFFRPPLRNYGKQQQQSSLVCLVPLKVSMLFASRSRVCYKNSLGAEWTDPGEGLHLEIRSQLVL